MFKKTFFSVIGCNLFFILSPVSAQAEKVYWIAYVATANNPQSDKCMQGLCIVRSDNSENRLLTDDVRFYSPLAWSPDGKQIAYISSEGDLYRIAINERKPILIADRWQLLILAGATKDQIDQWKSRQVIDVILEAIWVPDERGLFLILSPFPVASRPPFNIYRINIDGSDFHEIVHLQGIIEQAATSMSLSPDGKWLTYLESPQCRYCDFRGGRLYKVRLDGSEKELLLDEMPNVGAYAWSSTNNRIYYSYWETDKSWSIYSITSDGSERKLIMSNVKGNGYAPSLTVTNNYLYFALSEEAKFQKVHVVNLTTHETKLIPHDDYMGDGFERILASPTSDRVLAVGTDVAGLGSYGAGLAILNPLGNDDYTFLVGYPILEMYSATWSPVPIN